MKPSEQALVHFFERIARRDRALLESLGGEAAFRVDAEGWRFTLPGLFEYLRRRDAAFAEIDYKQFRKLIFASPINRTIRARGAEVVIAENRARVDRSTYALVWRDASG